MRVAVLRQSAPHAVVDADFPAIHFNGKSALENGENFRQFVVGASDAGTNDSVDALIEFAPQVVYPRIPSPSEVIIPLEKKWRHGPRPFYIVGSGFDPLLDFIGTNSDCRHRFFALTNVSTPVNAQLVLRYNLAFPGEPVTATTAPQPSYDAFYVLAYAALALGDGSVTGPELSRTMNRLLPPGHPVEVGPAGISTPSRRFARGCASISRGPWGRSISIRRPGKRPFTTPSSAAAWTARGARRARFSLGLVFDSASGSARGDDALSLTRAAWLGRDVKSARTRVQPQLHELEALAKARRFARHVLLALRAEHARDLDPREVAIDPQDEQHPVLLRQLVAELVDGVALRRPQNRERLGPDARGDWEIGASSGDARRRRARALARRSSDEAFRAST